MFSFDKSISETVGRHFSHLSLAFVSIWLCYPLVAVAQPSQTEPVQTPDERPFELIRVSAVSASDFLTGEYAGYDFGPDNLIDGRLNTTWQVSGGEGEWIQLDFGYSVTLAGLEIANGFQHVDPELGALFSLNNRIATAQLSFSDGTQFEVAFQADNDDTTSVVFGPRPTEWVRLDITSVHLGTRWNDLAVSEIRARGEAGPCGALLDLQHEVFDRWQAEHSLTGLYLCDMEGERDDIEIDPVLLSCVPSTGGAWGLVVTAIDAGVESRYEQYMGGIEEWCEAALDVRITYVDSTFAVHQTDPPMSLRYSENNEDYLGTDIRRLTAMPLGSGEGSVFAFTESSSCFECGSFSYTNAWLWSSDRISSVTVPNDAELIGLTDDDGDGAVDLLVHVYVASFSWGPAGMDVPGPRFLAHGLGDGTFSLDDAASHRPSAFRARKLPRVKTFVCRVAAG